MTRMKKVDKRRLHFSPPKFPHFYQGAGTGRDLLQGGPECSPCVCEEAVLVGLHWAWVDLYRGYGQQMKLLTMGTSPKFYGAAWGVAHSFWVVKCG